MRLRPCIDCGVPTAKTRCPQHDRRDIADEKARIQILKHWRDTHGDYCPGTPWCDTPNVPHPTRDLTVDHIKRRRNGGTLTDGHRIMCRTANTRRG